MSTLAEQNRKQQPALIALENQANAHFKNTRNRLALSLEQQLSRTLQHLFALRVLLEDCIVSSNRIACQHHIGVALTAVLSGEAELCIKHAREAEEWYQHLCAETPRLVTRT